MGVASSAEVVGLSSHVNIIQYCVKSLLAKMDHKTMFELILDFASITAIFLLLATINQLNT